MEVGELHGKVVYDLQNPLRRIKGFGESYKHAKAPDERRSFSKSDRKNFKRIAEDELKDIKHYARRFDLDEELTNYVSKKTLDLDLNITKICDTFEGLRLPFNNVWVEFKVPFEGLTPTAIHYPLIEKPKVYAVLFTRFKNIIENRNVIGLRFYSEDSFYPISYLLWSEGTFIPDLGHNKALREINEKYLSEEQKKLKMEQANEALFSDTSAFVYGVPIEQESYADSPFFMDQNTPIHHYQMNPGEEEELHKKFTEELWNRFKNQKSRFAKLVNRTEMITLDHYMGAVSEETDKLMNVDFLGALSKFAVCAIETLNYPWVQKDKAMRVVGKKSKTPRIVPHDHYYKAKIVLPKDEVVEIERNQPRKEHYGMRQHQVRGHWRVLKNEFGEVRKRIWIDSFVRGNPKLGIVYKDYVLEGDKQKIKEETKC